ncbi:MAG: hypothetical protein E7277_09925 [Lachnospiraceae bacterium]|nr:hypothetical protein [Lachnospiraceae bacterium]
MSEKRGCLICVACLLLCIFTACGTQITQSTVMQLEWKHSVVRPPEKDNLPLDPPKHFQAANYGGINYNFEESSFVKAKAKTFIKRETLLVTYADRILGKSRDGEDIYVNEWVKGRKASIEDGITFEALWTALNMVHKASGLELYGLFYLYCEENKLCDVKETEVRGDAIAKYFSEEGNLFLLDFSMPMLDKRVFDEEQIQMTKAAARSFATWYVKQNSLERYEKLCGNLEQADRKQLEQEKNAWLKSIGCKAKYKELAKTFFRMSDQTRVDSDFSEHTADYEIERPDVVWAFYAEDIKRMGYQQMVMKYSQVEPRREKDFADARRFLKAYLPKKLEKVVIFLNFHSDTGSAGKTSYSKPQIVMNNYWYNVAHSLLHEYIHFLTIYGGKMLNSTCPDFCSEGVAQWISQVRLENREAQLYIPFLREVFPEENSTEGNLAYGEYKGFLQCVKDEDSKDSKRKPPKGLPYAVDIDSMYYYTEYAVILEYVYQTYGMEKTIALLQSDGDFEKVLGKSLDYIYFEAADYAKEQMEAEDR